jgi:hypothetical protein
MRWLTMIGTLFSISFSNLAISHFTSAVLYADLTPLYIILKTYGRVFRIPIQLNFQQTPFTFDAFFSFLVHISDQQNVFTDYILFLCIVFPRVPNTIYCAWLRLAEISQFFAHFFVSTFIKKTASPTAPFFTSHFFMIRFIFSIFASQPPHYTKISF